MKPTSITVRQQLINLLASNRVTEPTRQALQQRLSENQEPPRFFTPHYFDLLNLVCDRLVDQDSVSRIVDVATQIDDRLASGLSDGWRYDAMPPDGEMLLRGLAGIDETARLMYKKDFMELAKEAQITVLYAIQQGQPPGQTWETLLPKRFFEELLAETVEIFYSHPIIQLDMEYDGMADALGWKNIGLNEQDTID